MIVDRKSRDGYYYNKISDEIFLPKFNKILSEISNFEEIDNGYYLIEFSNRWVDEELIRNVDLSTIFIRWCQNQDFQYSISDS